MTTIQPLTFACFAIGAAFAVFLWRRRNQPGAYSFLILTALIWVGIGMRLFYGKDPQTIAASLAVLQLVPALLYAAVLDYLSLDTPRQQLLRRLILGIGAGFCAIAVTSHLHGGFIEVAADGAVTYKIGGMLARFYAGATVGLSIYTVLRHSEDDATQMMPRLVVFVGLPVALLGLYLLVLVFDWRLQGLDPGVFGIALATAIASGVLYRHEHPHYKGLVRDLLFAQLQDPVVAVNDERRILDCNKAFAELLELPLDEVVGALLGEVCSADNMGTLIDPDRTEYMVQWRLGDGELAHYQVQSTPLARRGGLSGVLLLMSEHSSRLHTEQALETADIKLEQANSSLDRLKLHDELTGLANQRYFLDELEREVARHQRSERRFGIIAIEADHFHLLAEQHGAALRDRALALIARAIEVEVRGTDLCAHLEGEEFVVLATQMKVPGLVHLAERIRKRVLKVRPLSPDGDRVRMSVSCGVGIFDPKQDDLRGLLARTNAYLAKAKRTGRNKVISDDS